MQGYGGDFRRGDYRRIETGVGDYKRVLETGVGDYKRVLETGALDGRRIETGCTGADVGRRRINKTFAKNSKLMNLRLEERTEISLDF